jgi:surface antigen
MQKLAHIVLLSSLVLLASCSSFNSKSAADNAVVPIVATPDLTGSGEVPPPAVPATAANPDETPTTTTDAGTTGTPVSATVGGLSSGDQDKLSHALDAPIGQPTTWVSTANCLTYTVVPTTKVTINGNPYCRKYNVKVERGARTSAYTGTACVGADSTWKVASESGN